MVLFALPLVSLPLLALLVFGISSDSIKLFAEKGRGKDHRMSLFVLFLLLLLVLACSYGYSVYRAHQQQQARERKRNQFNDRV